MNPRGCIRVFQDVCCCSCCVYVCPCPRVLPLYLELYNKIMFVFVKNSSLTTCKKKKKIFIFFRSFVQLRSMQQTFFFTRKKYVKCMYVSIAVFSYLCINLNLFTFIYVPLSVCSYLNVDLSKYVHICFYLNMFTIIYVPI